MSGAVRFFEVMGQDTDNLKGFLGELFGWRFQPVPGMDYALIQAADGGIGGGLGGKMGGPAGWTTVYVKVDSVSDAVAKACKLGGTVLLPELALPDGMRVAVITDPEGHPIGLSSGA